MKLNVEILAYFLAKENAQILFPNLQLNATEIMELQCYQALYEIREIVRDDTLDDAECFDRIERVICTLESIGSNGGNRHDFG